MALSNSIDLKRPREVAKQFVLERFFDESRKLGLLTYWQGDYFRYSGAHYLKVECGWMRSVLAGWLADKTDHRGQSISPKKRDLDEVEDALRCITFLGEVLATPAWVTQDARETFVPARNLIACKNGLLNVQGRQLLSLTPEFFCTSSLSIEFKPMAGEPTEFLRFLNQIWPEDPDSIEALQEWFGLLLTRQTCFQKVLMVVGPKRSGKGTIGRLLGELVGSANMAFPAFGSLGKEFGLAGLIEKQVALMSDARLSGRQDVVSVVENMLRITGEDSVSVPRKHISDWAGQLPTRFVILTNEVPALSDASGALAGRFIVLKMNQSFFGNEDPHLLEKLRRDLPGILNWSLDGLDRLMQRGRLLQPKSGLEAIQQLEVSASPIKAFVADQCELGPQFRVSKETLFEEWAAWCRKSGRDFPTTEATFARQLYAAFPSIKESRPLEGGARIRCYEGIQRITSRSPTKSTQLQPFSFSEKEYKEASGGADPGPAWTEAGELILDFVGR